MLWSLSKKIKKNIENSYGDIKEGRFDTLGKVKRELNLFSKYYELSLLGRLYMNQKFYLPRIFYFTDISQREGGRMKHVTMVWSITLLLLLSSIFVHSFTSTAVSNHNGYVRESGGINDIFRTKEINEDYLKNIEKISDRLRNEGNESYFSSVIDERFDSMPYYEEENAVHKDYVIIDGHATGLRLPSKEELKTLLHHKLIVGVKNKAGSLSPSVRWDLDSHFPPVGNQGPQGSCAAWAVSYYQNGFLQRRIYNWTDSSLEHLMSPSWTYNKVNKGLNRGSTFESNIEILKSIGDATIANMTYDPQDYTSWGDENAWRDAPKHRIGDYYIINIGNDSGIAIIKEFLDKGYLVTFAIDAYQFDNGFADGNYIISSNEYNSNLSNHAQTIVGYDDNVTDDGDNGSFRVVNSWGTYWGDHGFYWVTYKALEEKISQGWPYAYVLIPISDKTYNPKLLATWHFSSPGSRDESINITIGEENSTHYKAPVWDGGTRDFPEFMALDITEMYSLWKNSSYNDIFYLKIGIENEGSKSSVVSSFRIEYYPYGYKFLWQNTTESIDVPIEAPAVIESSILYPSKYSPYLYVDPRHALFHEYYHLKVLDVIVGNAGNASDVVLLDVNTSSDWSVTLSTQKLILAPNVSEIVRMYITPPSHVKLGENTIIEIKATSQYNTSRSYILRIKEMYLSNLIYIDGDFDLKYKAEVYGWPGNGSAENPYVISGYSIDGKNISFGIYIRNTRMHFIIRDCEIYHNALYYSWPTPYGEGIWFYNVWYGEIENNSLYNNGNYTERRGGDGILLEHSQFCKIYNNIIENNWNGMTLFHSDNNMIKSNDIVANGAGGIFLRDSIMNKIYNNNMEKDGISIYGDFSTYVSQEIPKNNTVNGLPVYYGKNLKNITITENFGEIILGNVSNVKIENMDLLDPRCGVQIGYSSHINIENSTLGGIVIQNSNDIVVNNIIAGGIVPIRSSHIIIENSTFKGGAKGVYLYATKYSILRNNLVEEKEMGFTIVYSEYNLIENNTLYNNTNGYGYGIYLYYSSDNIFQYNVLSSNNYGIYLNSYSTNNIFTDNQIYENRECGIYIVSNSEYNRIWNNSFYYNNGAGDKYSALHIQAYDNGNNSWNDTSGHGNYWHDWANNNDTNDENEPYEIVDWPYKIDGNAGVKDCYPLKESPNPIAPSNPQNLTVKSGERYVNLTWEKPLSNGGSDITEYRIYRNGTLIANISGEHLWYNDTNVVNGQTYTYYVTAVNAAGESPKSNEVEATPWGAVPEIAPGLLGIMILIALIALLRNRR